LIIGTGHLEELRLDFDALGQINSLFLFLALLLLFIVFICDSSTSTSGISLHLLFLFLLRVEDQFVLILNHFWIDISGTLLG
jgi:hypothetical protein